MTAAPPADQAARDRIRDDLDVTLFVEAGAGTGKTRALVERIVRLVASGRTTADRIAAITFTEAAAAELRDRVLVALEEGAAAPELPAAERRRCGEALAVLDEAAVETLHSFAARILSTYPLEAGLPPGFEVLDDTLAAIAFEERWSEHLDAMLDDPALSAPLRRALAMGVAPDDLRTLARALHGDWERLREATLPSAPRTALDLEPVVEELDLVCAERSHCVEPDDLLSVHLERLEPFAQQLRNAAGDELEALRLLSNRPRLRTGGGRAQSWKEIAPREIRDALTELEGRCDALLTAEREAAIPPLYESLRRFVLDGAEGRRRHGQLEFHDLLVRARDLLRDDAGVRGALRQRFTHLLIDEFQDTDPIQSEIAFLLAADHDQPPRSWPDAPVDAGRLFFVGDPKQSIYRFRGADIELYKSVQERFAASTERLTQNFRSVPAITSWVNGVFEQLMGGAAHSGQATYVPLRPGRPAHPDPLTVLTLGGPQDANVATVRRAEAAEIARVTRGVKAGRWQVMERDGGVERARDARFQDIAILVPARTSLPALLEALEAADIPYRLESRSLVYEAQEVRELLSILRALDDPTDEVALVAALRSPAFACGDDDLFRFAERHGRWDYRAATPDSLPDGDPVVEALRWLRGAHEGRWWKPVSAIVEGVIRERRMLELATVDGRPRERWQRLRFVLDQARAFSDAGGRTLREFLAWTERQAEEGARVIETVVPEEDDDAVRIMTVHAAKGLQFPIVVMSGLNAQPRRDGGPVLWSAGDAPELRLRGGFQTAGYDALRQHDRELQELEDVRLLHVAATRARDYLVVSLFHSQRGASAAARIHAIVQELPGLAREPGPSSASAPIAPPPAIAPDTADDRAAWLARREAAIADLRALPAVSATALAKAAAERADPNPEKEEPSEELEPWRRGRAGTAIGRAVHSTLQTIDLASGAALGETSRAQATAEGVAGRAEEVGRLVRAALDAPAVREAVASGRYWREVYVGAPVDGALLEGFIDLLYETRDGFVVVDYKTDRLAGDEDADAALARYEPQGAAYALALSETLGRPVTRCVFLFLSEGGAIERELANLDDAATAARDLVTSGSWTR